MGTTLPLPQTRGRSGVKLPVRGWMRWALTAVILAAIVGGALWWRSSQQATTPTFTTSNVTQGDLAVLVSGSGSVAAARMVDVPFQQSGTVTSVAVVVGDTVTAGQTLAQIDPGDLELAVQQAQASLKAAEAQYAAAQGGEVTDQDLAIAEASLTSAQAQFDATKNGTATAADIASAQAQLTSAKAQLAALKNPSQVDLIAAQNQLAQARANLESTRDNLSQSKTNAYLQMQQSVNALTQAQSKYATAKSNWDFIAETGQDPTNPETTGTDGKTVKNRLSDTQRQQYYDTYVQAEAALHTAELSVEQARVAYDLARETEVNQIPLAEQEVTQAQAQLDALLHPDAVDLAQAQAQVTQAQASLDKLREGGTAAEIAQAQAQVLQAQATLDDLTAPGTDAEIASAEATLLQARVNLASARRSLEEATLTAPFDGVIAAVNLQPGATVSGGGTAVTLVDTSTLHIDVSLSETDTGSVAVGQSVTLTFDALPDVTLTGRVASIAPVATVEQNVVTYVVLVEFDPGETQVKVGMSATADIQVQQATGVLLVPSRAVQTTGDVSSVQVLQPGSQTPVRVPVETGLTSDGMTEIISSGGGNVAALKVGDLVMVTSSSISSSSNSSSSNAGMQMGGPPPNMGPMP